MRITTDLFVTSKKKPRIHQLTNPRIITAVKRPESLINPFLMVYYFLFITLKKTFKVWLFHFKALKRHFAAL